MPRARSASSSRAARTTRGSRPPSRRSATIPTSSSSSSQARRSCSSGSATRSTSSPRTASSRTRRSASSSRARRPRRWRSRRGSACSSCRRIFERLQPDVVVTVADRFETLATAVAAAYMNIPVAHTQGGEISGSIDESVRHAVTKLAHIHFPATELAAQRVIAMGEDPAWVFNVGCPSIDLVARTDLGPAPRRARAVRRPGEAVDPEQPVPARHAAPGDDRVRPRARADQPDARGGRASSGCRRSSSGRTSTRAPRTSPRASGSSASSARRTASTSSGTCPPEVFVKLMAHCSCMVGNSSSALREGSFLGTPAVTVGTRQQGRERGPNLVEVGARPRRDRRRDPRPDRARTVRAEPPLRRRHRRPEDRRHRSRGCVRPCRSGCCSRSRPSPTSA